MWGASGRGGGSEDIWTEERVEVCLEVGVARGSGRQGDRRIRAHSVWGLLPRACWKIDRGAGGVFGVCWRCARVCLRGHGSGVTPVQCSGKNQGI